MLRIALGLFLFAASTATAADLPPGARVRLSDDRFRAGSGIEHLAISPDGKQYATVQSCRDDILSLTMWDAESGRPIREQFVNRDLFKGMVWGEGGAFAVVVRAETQPKGRPAKVFRNDFRVWNFTDSKTEAPPLAYLPRFTERTNGSINEESKPESHYSRFHFSADGRYLAAEWESEDGKFTIHVFELEPAASATRLHRVSTIDLGTEEVDAVRFSADGQRLVVFRELAHSEYAGIQFTATVWDVARGKPHRLLKPFLVQSSDPFAGVRGLLLAPEGRAVYVPARDEKEWGIDEVPLDLAFKAPDPKQRRSVVRWPLEPGSEKRIASEFCGHAFNASGTMLVLTANGKTHILDTAGGKELGRLEGHAATPGMVAISANESRIVTADMNGLVRVWDAKTLRPLHEAPGHRAQIEHAQFSPNGKLLLTWAWDGTARLWDIGTGKELRAFADVDDGRLPVFTPDGTAIIYSNKKALIARDLQTGLEVPLPKNANKLEPHDVNHWNTWLEAWSSRDGTAVEVSGSDGVRRELRGHRGETRVLGFTPGGTRLLTTGGDHTILVWDMQLQAVPLPESLKNETDAGKLWKTLAVGNTKDAYLAMARLAREPDAALKLLKMKFKPAAKEDQETDASRLIDTRALELLEALDTDEARAYLKKLAAGHAEAFRTQKAKRALERQRK